MPETIIVNGKPFTGVEFETGVNQAKYITFSKTGEILGSTKQSDLLAWAATAGMKAQTVRALKMAAEVGTRGLALSPAKDEELGELYTKKEELHRWQIKRALQELGIDEHDREKIAALRGDINNLLFGSLFGSAIIYDKTGYQGDWRYLSPGAHPKLSWYNFNDKTDSALVFPGEFLTLYQHTWFRGYALFLYWSRSDLGWFNNRASSAWIW